MHKEMAADIKDRLQRIHRLLTDKNRGLIEQMGRERLKPRKEKE